MGSLAGHVLPGCFFLVHGLIWAVLSIWTQLSIEVNGCKRKKSSSSSSSSLFKLKQDPRLVRKSWIPLPCCPRVPLEPILKVLMTTAGILVEGFLDYKQVAPHSREQHLVFTVYHAFLSNGHFNDVGKLHHITMYAAFLLSGIVDLMTLCARLPRQTSPIFLSLALWVEWMLFYSHSHGDNMLNIHAHSILTAIILSCVIFSALRVFQSSHFLINLGLAFCVMLQGTWFIQVGLSLYPPSGTNILIESSRMQGVGAPHAVHSVTMFVYALFTWHVVLLAVSFLGLWVVFACFWRCFANCCRAKLSRADTSLESNVECEEAERLVTPDKDGDGGEHLT